jgi:hypothetical protein
MMEGLMDGKVLSTGAYSVGDCTLLARPFGKRAPHHRLDAGAYLIMTVLLSLGVWAAIWGAVASLFSAAG